MLFAGVAIAVSAVIGTIWSCSRRQQRSLSLQLDRLRSSARPTGHAVTRIGTQILDGVPAPVGRYLRWALRDTTHIHEVRIAQTGSLRTDARTDSLSRLSRMERCVGPVRGRRGLVY
jgi:hypothetical protein